MKQEHAPLFTQSYDLYAWLLDRCDREPKLSWISQPLLKYALVFLEAITLALQGFTTYEHLQEADESLALIRLHLKISEMKGLLQIGQYEFAIGQADEMGRQLGGWLKQWTT